MRRILTLLLALLLVFSMAVTAFAVPGAEETKRAIGIVFDNSGSMYIGSEDGRKVWCRATYATEAFAAMMNPNDILQVYPMNPITVGNETYTYEKPLVIGQSEASTIRQIYSPKPGDTHIETITAACEGIMQVEADEKWLVVLTDGDEFYRNGKGLGTGKGTIAALENDLSACAAKMNVMYLGMGSQSAMPNKVTSNYFYQAKKTANSTEVLAALSEMCNTIFGRDSLTDVGETVSFDISMSKLILFVQGEGIKNLKLGDISPTSTNEMQYSTLGAGASYKDKFLVDESLQGVLAIFEDVDAGSLALSYEGKASSIDCYYEPNVDLQVQLLDAAGTPVDPNAELTAGTYLLSYGIVDKYGAPVNSPLLGQTVYTVNHSINDDKQTVTSEQADKLQIDLKANDVLDVSVKAAYLGGYTLEKTAQDLGWPTGGLKFVPPPAGMLEAKLTGGAQEYKLSALTQGEPFRVEFIYEGQALTGAQLDGLEELQATLDGGNAQCTLERDDQGYYITLAPYEVPFETDCCEYELQFSGIYRNEDGLPTNRAFAAASLKVIDDSRTLDMKVAAPQTYYQLSKLSEGEPITLKLYYSGEPLTEEELNGITVKYEAEGLTLLTEKDPANSAILLWLDPANPPAEGKYRVNITANGVNEIGKEQVCEGRVTVETGKLAMWLKILIPILVIAVIIGIVAAILNQKVLPKDVALRDEEFSVDGSKIKGSNARINDPGKHKSEIVINSAKYSMDPGAPQQLTLSVTALSNRLTPSHKRKYMITAVKLRNATQVRSWELKGSKYKADSAKPGNFKNVANGGPFKEIMAGPKTSFLVKSETRQGAAVTFRGTLVSK